MSTLQKLSEEALTRPPEEVFDMICKLGKQMTNHTKVFMQYLTMFRNVAFKCLYVRVKFTLFYYRSMFVTLFLFHF